MKKLIVFIFIIISSNSLEAQINSDSLWNVWNDTTQTAEDRIIAIDKIIYNNYLFVKPDSAFVLAQDMYHFAVENKLEKNIGGAPSCSSSQNISSSSEENYDWEIVKTDKNDSPSWIIYTRKIASTNFLEYKIEGDIKSSPKACISSFRQDIHNQVDDTENKRYPTYDMVYESKDSLVTYVIHNEPFPLKDTEMSIRYIFYDNEAGNKEVRWHEAWDDNSVSTSKKLKRVETFRGHWNFSPIANESCEAANSVSFDPKKMPLWLVEPMVFNFLKNGLEDLRETAAKL